MYLFAVMNSPTGRSIKKIVDIPCENVGCLMSIVYFTVRTTDVPTLPVIITFAITIAMGANSSCSYFVLRPLQSMRWAAAPTGSSSTWLGPDSICGVACSGVSHFISCNPQLSLPHGKKMLIDLKVIGKAD